MADDRQSPESSTLRSTSAVAPWARPVAAAVAVIACLVPLMMGAGRTPATSEATNRERIEGMTEIERRRLKQRFERFQQLSEDEREHLREMHQQIESSPELLKTVEAYRAWVETLSPLQRERLRNETDPTAKLALAKQFRAEQRVSERGSRGPFAFLPPGMGGGRRPPKVNPRDLDAVYQVLEQKVEPTADERQRLDSAGSQLQRRLALLKIGMGRLPRWPLRGSRFPDDATVDAMIASLESGPTKRMLEGSKSSDGRRSRVVMLLLGGIWQEFSHEVEERKPSAEELREYFAKRTPEERDRLTSLSKEEFERELRRSYLMDSLREFEDVRPVTQNLFRMMGGGRPPFGGRGRGRDDGPGPPRPPNGRPPGGEGRPDGPPPRRPGEGRPGGFGGRRPGESSGRPFGQGGRRGPSGTGSES